MVDKLEAGERWQHVKRGTFYDVIGLGELQMQSDLVDGSSLVIYRGEDGRLWARGEGEFLDGRFVKVATPANGEQVERAGWQLVPVNLTQEMLDATCATDADDTAMRTAWAELLRTAPKPSTPTEDARERVKVLEEALERVCDAYDDASNYDMLTAQLEAAVEEARALGNKETDRHG